MAVIAKFPNLLEKYVKYRMVGIEKTKMNLLVKVFLCVMIELDASNAVEIGFWDTENALFVSTLSEYTGVSQGQKY